MANVTVTMLQSGRTDDWGRPLVAGNSYSLDFDRAKSLWQAGFASVADPAVFDDDNTPVAGGLIRYLRFPGFRKSLLASLVTNSTASRANGLVTVAATSHGIATGATYQGFRFFYPGSPNLAAGWYDSILSVPDANTLTFSAPGPDFASESINAGAAYTLITEMASITIPAGTLKPGSRLTTNFLRYGDSTSTTKSLRNILQGTSIGSSFAATSPSGWHRVTSLCRSATEFVGVSANDNALTGTITTVSVESVSDERILGFSGQVNAAVAFVAVQDLSLEIVQ